MTLGEVLAQVLVVAPYPDKELLIRQKLNAAVNLISKSGHFWRDIEETTIGVADGVDATLYTQSIPITTAQRKFIYVKSTNTNEKPITLIDAVTVAKADCQGLLPIAYTSGTQLHIKHEQLTAEFNLSYYTSPTAFDTDGTDDAETNWILDLASELVVDLTASYVLNLVGDKEDSKRIGDFATILQGTYIRDFIDSYIG